MRKLYYSIPIAATASLALLLIGCGSATTPLPPGTFISEITTADVKSASEYNLIDVHELSLLPNGHFMWAGQQDATKTEDGRYTVTGDQFIIEDEQGSCARTAKSFAKGTYKYTFDGTQVTFTAIQDNCGWRAFVFTKHPWTKQ